MIFGLINREVEKREERGTAHASIKYLLAVPPKDIEEWTTKFNLKPESVTRKADDLYNFCLSKGKTYRNYRAFLASALSRDADELRIKEKTHERKMTHMRFDEDTGLITRTYSDGTKEVSQK